MKKQTTNSVNGISNGNGSAKNDGKGKGHQARVAVSVRGSIKLGDAEPETMEMSYDLTVTIEQIEYAIRQIAGTISKVAARVAVGDTMTAADRTAAFARQED